MSAIGGIYNFDGAPVDDEILSTLGNGLAARGPDGSSQCKSGSIAMVYRAFHTNRESRFETQPLLSSRGDILCWDGRLDNREELISILREELDGDHTDVAIVMAAYLKWGIGFLPRIIGDFALAIWNPALNTLILGRDLIGPRMLYYHRNECRVIWSTELRPLLDLAGIPLEINDEYVAGFLTNFPEPGQTPYKNIEAVVPAHAVIIRQDKVHVHRFWQPDPNREIRYRTDAEYEEHFRQLFREAVGCRLRVDGPVWSELSGGMDSSSIVCMAEYLITRGEVPAQSLETASRVFDEASKSDEREYILPVEAKIGKRGLHLREDDYRLLASWEKEYVPTIPSYVSNFAAYYKAVNKAMHERGGRVLLSGLGGDEILLGDGDPFPELGELLVKGRLLRLHSRLLDWNRSAKKSYFRSLWHHVIMPLLPQKLQIARNRSLDKVLRFYNQEFVKRMNLRRRMFGPSDDFDFPWPGGRFQWVAFSYASRQLSGGYWQELCEAEFSYPFTHRPLVEFMLAIPIVQKVRPGESKSLLRRALRDFLPPELVNHKERITNLDAMVHAVARERSRIQGMFKNARSSAYGYLNSEAILESCNHKRKQADPFIMSLVPFEYWLQSLDRRWINRTSGTERVPARLHLGGLTTANQQTGAANTKMLFKDDPKRCGIWFV